MQCFFCLRIVKEILCRIFLDSIQVSKHVFLYLYDVNNCIDLKINYYYNYKNLNISYCNYALN